MKTKTRFPEEGGFTARLLVAGEVDMAIQQVGELLSVAGAELLGPLPGDLQSVTTFAIAVPATASQPDAAKAFIRYLRSPQAAAVMKAKGLDPVEDPR
jgi:molybdate transport system substrate-binding protein